MGTHPIFESDFDCLTESERVSYDKSRRTFTNWAVEIITVDS